MYTVNFGDLTFLGQGAITTILLSLGTMAISLPVAVLVGLVRSVRKPNIFVAGVQFVFSVVVSAVRGTPLMAQLIFLFFGLPMMGIEMPSLTAAMLGLSLYSIAYLAEIVRGGIDSVAKDQWDAATALGLNYLQTMWRVILPQAVRIMLPPSVSFFIGLIKDSSLVAVIGFVELARAGRIIVERTNQSLLIFVIVAVVYFIICYPLSLFSQRLERALKV
jgi:polar amino acid transport system permease protein